MCLDTGHQAYAGIDPVALYRKYHERVHYLHFKNVDAAVLAGAVERELDLFTAAGEGVFSALADGVVDFPALKIALDEHGYDGWATIEDELPPVAATRRTTRGAAWRSCGRPGSSNDGA